MGQRSAHNGSRGGGEPPASFCLIPGNTDDVVHSAMLRTPVAACVTALCVFPRNLCRCRCVDVLLPLQKQISETMAKIIRKVRVRWWQGGCFCSEAWDSPHASPCVCVCACVLSSLHRFRTGQATRGVWGCIPP